MRTKYKATIIGAIVTLVSVLATWTFIVPIVSIIPLGASFERLFTSLFTDSDYFSISLYISLTLLILLGTMTGWYFKKVIEDNVEKRKFRTDRLAIFFMLLFFMIHPFIFYIWAMVNSDHAGDGQFIFGILETFPISSFAFVIFGFFIDAAKNKKELSGENE